MKRDHSVDVARVTALAGELRALIGKVKRRLREQSDLGDLTGSQLSALARLEREGSGTVSSLARAEGMRPQSMGAIVAALEAAGLVQGRPDPNDGRQTILSLTEACRERVTKKRAARQDWLVRAIAARLSSQEQATVAAAIALLNRLVDE
jgi:DNA-binding MarR family transcriptional regulator